MKIAKLKTTPIQATSQGVLKNYYVVPDNHVFTVDENDVTNFDNLLIMSNGGKFDYGIFRDSLVANVITDWYGLSFDDRKKCVQHYKYPNNLSPGEFETYFTTAEHEYNWSVLAARTRAMRLTRLFAAFNKISYNLTTAQVGTIYLTVKQMCFDYYYANMPHIIYWVQNGVYAPLGINFSANGFNTFAGYTDSVRDQILDVLVNGNFTNVDTEVPTPGFRQT